MLSKKMAVSLTSLITILAFAFIAPTALAQTFGFALDDSNDVSEAKGLQLERPADNKLKVTVVSDEAVILPKANISIGGFTMKGDYIPAVELEGDPPTDAKSKIELTIAITADTYKVSLMIAKDIASANAFSNKKSAAFTADVMVVGSDTTLAPQVYGIRRADNAVSPLTGGAVDVIITLSEEPQAFDAAHINVSSNATAGTPVKLATVVQNDIGLTQFSTHLDTPAPTPRTLEQIRDGVKNTDGNILKDDGAVADGAMGGIDYLLSVHAEANPDKIGDYIAAVIALKNALKSGDLTFADATDTAKGPDVEVIYVYLNKDGNQETAVLEYEAAEDGANVSPTADGNGDTTEDDAEKGMPIIDGAVVAPTTQGIADIVLAAADPIPAITIAKEVFDRSAKKTSYTRPAIADFTTLEEYNFAQAQYNALTGTDSENQRKAYAAEKAIYDKYLALQKLIQEDDMDRTAEWQESLVAKASEGVSVIAENVLPPTGRDGMLHPYMVTLTPTYKNANDIVVSVNKWQTQAEKVNRVTGASSIGTYRPPVLETDFTDGYNQLTIGVSPSAVKKTPVSPRGIIEITLPAGFMFRAASPGFTIFAADAAGSGIAIPGGTMPATGHTGAVLDTARSPAEQEYDVIDYPVMNAALPTPGPAFPNLQNFLINGGTIHIIGVQGLVISEVMWGTDLSLSPHTNSQWIEIKNVTGSPVSAAGFKLSFVAPNETLPVGDVSYDSVSAYDATTKSVWDIRTKGQGGRTGTGEAAGGVTTVVDPTALVSMQRVFSDTATQLVALPGTKADNWAMSMAPALNFDREAVGQRIGSPGTDPLNPPIPVPPKVPPQPPTVPPAVAGDIVITEVMVDTSEGLFPQWIELTHIGTGKVTLNGWGMVIDNAIDGEVLGGGNAITVGLSGTLDVSKDTRNADAGQSLLLVAWASKRHSTNLRANGILDIGPRLGQDGRYQLLSYEGFRITLVPPQTGAVANFGDIVGNLHEDWKLPMLEGPKRSSMIRQEMSSAGTMIKGTDANGWILASATPLISGPETFYGNDEDAGTPGYDAGGPLPVELSHFRPARDKQTGAVVITWSTQSELNNAGFFIKRSNQRNGDFKVINATMVPGVGTTSEKQFYTYTDTTAQPNVVYYYQIEDVSLDGNRQLLTRGIRLKGHVSAAGKATTLWGELKTSHE